MTLAPGKVTGPVAPGGAAAGGGAPHTSRGLATSTEKLRALNSELAPGARPAKPATLHEPQPCSYLPSTAASVAKPPFGGKAAHTAIGLPPSIAATKGGVAAAL